MTLFSKLPGYVWTLISLLLGLTIGGLFSDNLSFVASGTHTALKGFIKIVPLIIFFALSPAIYKLIQQGNGGKLAMSVVSWYLLTSVVAGLLGLVMSSLLFGIEFGSSDGDHFGQARQMLSMLSDGGSASWPILAIFVSVFIGLIAHKFHAISAMLVKFDVWMNQSTPYLTKVMPFIVFFLGITLGVNTGATESMKYYLLMTLYTFVLCVSWLVIYQLIAIKLIAKQSIRKVLKQYFFPTAVFAAGTCSSLATLPVNLDNVKKVGVDNNIANFVLPIGSVINLDTSALAYVAYAPFIMTVVFDMSLNWNVLLVAWPAIVLFTIAAPGLPAGMGTALWSSTLFASLMGLGEQESAMFITTWLALSGGLPDMFRTATNCTCDGFTAIMFNKKFGEQSASPEPTLAQQQTAN